MSDTNRAALLAVYAALCLLAPATTGALRRGLQHAISAIEAELQIEA